jgi:hypothetical protein
VGAHSYFAQTTGCPRIGWHVVCTLSQSQEGEIFAVPQMFKRESFASVVTSCLDGCECFTCSGGFDNGNKGLSWFTHSCRHLESTVVCTWQIVNRRMLPYKHNKQASLLVKPLMMTLRCNWQGGVHVWQRAQFWALRGRQTRATTFSVGWVPGTHSQINTQQK